MLRLATSRRSAAIYLSICIYIYIYIYREREREREREIERERERKRDRERERESERERKREKEREREREREIKREPEALDGRREVRSRQPGQTQNPGKKDTPGYRLQNVCGRTQLTSGARPQISLQLQQQHPTFQIPDVIAIADCGAICTCPCPGHAQMPMMARAPVTR
jgi:hypothetical protein